jgi:hypothetical protein
VRQVKQGENQTYQLFSGLQGCRCCVPVHHEGKSDGVIDDNAAEILAEGRIAKDILAGLGETIKRL